MKNLIYMSAIFFIFQQYFVWKELGLIPALGHLQGALLAKDFAYL
jgi:hypothetical protein